jgi:hypothetical protein
MSSSRSYNAQAAACIHVARDVSSLEGSVMNYANRSLFWLFILPACMQLACVCQPFATSTKHSVEKRQTHSKGFCCQSLGSPKTLVADAVVFICYPHRSEACGLYAVILLQLFGGIRTM